MTPRVTPSTLAMTVTYSDDETMSASDARTYALACHYAYFVKRYGGSRLGRMLARRDAVAALRSAAR